MTADFYDGLAPYYHLIFEDWQASIDRHGPDGPPITRVFRSRYYAIPADRLLELMRDAGFENVRRVDEGFYQPVLVGTRPDAG